MQIWPRRGDEAQMPGACSVQQGNSPEDMSFQRRYVDWAGVEIASFEPAILRCRRCGAEWGVELGERGDILTAGGWRCPNGCNCVRRRHKGTGPLLLRPSNKI